jgi:murein DD-endopeptidase MepM/ murein hydrolase activator NlpD
VCALSLPAPAAASFPDHPADQRASRSAADRVVVPLRGPLHERFGYARGRLHAGIDIAVLGTDSVRAALPGVVTAVGYLEHYSGYGNVVKIRHEGGMQTMYAHLASAEVRVGDYVDAGDRIGRAGCTGSCTGPHLHFEVRIRGRLVDPLRLLRGSVR